MNLAQQKSFVSNLKKIRDLEPWFELSEDMVFEIEMPNKPFSYYCVFFGEMQESEGFVAYKGDEGLQLHMKMVKEEAGELENGMEYVNDFMNTLNVSFEFYENLTEEDLSVIGPTKIRFGKENKWPSFMKCTPGKITYILEETEFEDLNIIANQLIQSLETIRSSKKIRRAMEKGDILRRSPVKDFTPIVWEQTLINRPESIEFTYPPVELDELYIRRCNKKIKVKLGRWEMGFLTLPMPSPSQEDETLVYPKLLMILDTKSEQVLMNEVLASDSTATEYAEHLLEMFAAQGITTTLCLKSKYLYHLLSQVLIQPKVQLKLVKELPLTDEIMEQMMLELFDEMDLMEDEWDDDDEDLSDEEIAELEGAVGRQVSFLDFDDDDELPF